MNKIKIERSIKLRQEEFKNRSKYDIVTGCDQGDNVWIDSFGKQADSIKSPIQSRNSQAAMKEHWTRTLQNSPNRNGGVGGHNPIIV